MARWGSAVDFGESAAETEATRPGGRSWLTSTSGVLAVWSSGPNAAFTQRLAKAGFTVEEVKVKAHRGRSGAKHVIWIAVRPGA